MLSANLAGGSGVDIALDGRRPGFLRDAVVFAASFLGVYLTTWSREWAAGSACWGSRLCAGLDNEPKAGVKYEVPVNNLKAAGLSSSRDSSSLMGVRHFWQYIVVVVC